MSQEDVRAGRRAFLLGDPVAHSLSPRLHNAGFALLGLPHRYEALQVAAGDFNDVVTRLGIEGALGANVTVPHKLRAFERCDVVTDEAALIGAVNTLWWVGGALHGTNTDASGFGRDLDETLAASEIDPTAGVTLVGTGGAARAVAVALGRRQLDVTVLGRRAPAAAVIVELVQSAGGSSRAADLNDAEALHAAVEAAAIVVNATSVGMHGERLPEPLHRLRSGQLAYDLVYGSTPSPFVADAIERGVASRDGRGMLAAQAEDAFSVWVGQRPPPGLFLELLS